MTEAPPLPANAPTSSNSGSGAFPPTQWSVVIRACADPTSATESRRALEALCGRYWYPLYAFIRRQGRSHHEAEDCTQEFLAHLLATDALQHASRERGRFRTFLLASLRHHLTSAWRHAHAEKRGGHRPHESLDFTGADERFRIEPVDEGLTPERAFDRSWALSMIAGAVESLRTEYSGTRERVFTAMAPLIRGAAPPDAIARGAVEAGMTANAFNVALHRARQRLGERLRTIVAETVADPSEVDAELRHLIAALGD